MLWLIVQMLLTVGSMHIRQEVEACVGYLCWAWVTKEKARGEGNENLVGHMVCFL
jgi:hypothetical protein